MSACRDPLGDLAPEVANAIRSAVATRPSWDNDGSASTPDADLLRASLRLSRRKRSPLGSVDVAVELDRMVMNPGGWFWNLQGVYAGWDGALVKFGVAGGADGLHARLRAYYTHNPLFRVVAFAPAHALGCASYADLERVESETLSAVCDHKYTKNMMRDDEWCYPVRAVLDQVLMLRGKMEEALTIARSSNREDLYVSISPRKAGRSSKVKP